MTDPYGIDRVKTVDVPHSWNSDQLWDDGRQKALSVKYQRGEGIYRKSINISDDYKGKRLFLRFGAANLVARVSMNGKFLGEHRGGYSAFVFEVTDAVQFGKKNTIEVAVDNTLFDDIAPLQGDFNVYGGLIRPVTLIIADPVNITLMDHGSPGVFISQRSVTKEVAELDVLTKVDNGSLQSHKVSVKLRLLDQDGKIVVRSQTEVEVSAGTTVPTTQSLKLLNPHLWQGTKDPYLYQVEITLIVNGETVDQVVQPIGLRDIKVDAQRGVFLNGEKITLKGVAFHEDWARTGAALSKQQREKDMEIINDMGANALRLAHYPHGSYTADLADQYGFLVWSEIPFLGFPIGPIGGYTDSDAFRSNLLQQLREMIRQNYNHPSMAFWGLYNELPNTEGKFDAREFLQVVQEVAKKEDPYRLTTSAAFETDLSLELNNITDIQFWNRYFGWYYGTVNSLGSWLDETHKAIPNRPIGVSEYGSGANIDHQRDNLKKPYGLSDNFHPENWQAFQHEGAWRDLAERDYPVGSFVWAMFDFSSFSRHEGGEPGLNDKGLVTYDRRVKKDAYYFYQANWSDKPMLHLTGKRNTNPVAGEIDIKAYSNLDEVELWVNGTSFGKRKPDQINRFVWNDIPIISGNSAIRVTGEKGGVVYEDAAIWYRSLVAEGSKIGTVVFSERYKFVPLLIVILLILYLRSYKFTSTPGGTQIAKFSFYGIGLVTLFYFGALLYMWQAGYLLTFN